MDRARDRGLRRRAANLALVVARLLRNQTDIGNAVKPYYGAAAGNQLTKLLKATSTPPWAC